jgi:geranylgeranyl diphosphate synthase type I
VADAQRMIDDRLADFLAAPDHAVVDDGGAIATLHAAIADLASSGGKRLRPAFVLFGGVAAGGTLGAPATLDAAAAVELLHTFALLHDDVMDRSATRRGKPTAQHAFAARCAVDGDPAWFGVSAAVLAGDLAFVWADQLFDASADTSDAAHHRTARRVFTLLRTEVIAGQYLDLRAGSDTSSSERDAVRIALLKSARYTVTRPLQLGAALAGGGPQIDALLGRYGDATGMAFQLRDDVLGMFGDPKHTGKSCADDLREGKRTLLVVRAEALTTDAGRAVLAASLGCADLDDVSAQRCRDVIAESGALASVEAAIEVELQRALAAASRLDPIAAEPLTELAELAARRDR